MQIRDSHAGLKILIATCQFSSLLSSRLRGWTACHERAKVERDSRTERAWKGSVQENRRSLVFIDINMVCPLCQFLAAISETRFPARSRHGSLTTSGKTGDVSVTVTPSALLFFLPLILSPFLTPHFCSLFATFSFLLLFFFGSLTFYFMLRENITGLRLHRRAQARRTRGGA